MRESFDAAHVVARLEEAGATLLCLPDTGPNTRLVLSDLGGAMLADAAGWTRDYAPLRPQVYSPARVSRMDEALAWLGLIPDDRRVLRRIVGARSLVSPLTERHLFSWRRIGVLLGADHKAIQRWHADGIGLIVSALAARRSTPEKLTGGEFARR